MRFNVLALDYDGTMAERGRANPNVVAALREARERGVTILLVTGRIFSDLKRVFPEWDLFDVIVAGEWTALASHLAKGPCFDNKTGTHRIKGSVQSDRSLGRILVSGRCLACYENPLMTHTTQHTLPIHITPHHLRLSPSLQSFVHEKLADVPRIAPDALSADVVLRRHHGTSSGPQFSASARVALPGRDIYGKAVHADLYSAIVKLSSRLARRSRKRKTRLGHIPVATRPSTSAKPLQE